MYRDAMNGQRRVGFGCGNRLCLLRFTAVDHEGTPASADDRCIAEDYIACWKPEAELPLDTPILDRFT